MILRPGPLLLGAAVGTAAYEGAVLLLGAAGALDREPAPEWQGRNAVLVFLGAVCAIAGVIWTRRARVTRRIVAASALVGVGLAWLAWELVDQHALSLYHLDLEPGRLLWDAAFHAAPAVAAGAGWAWTSR